MHRALLIDEILLNIFGHCHNGSYYTVFEVAPIARTCQAFKEPALDTLWFSLYDPSPLIRCLPKGFYEFFLKDSTQFYTLSKPLTQTEWDIIQRYMPRIRAIHSFGSGLDRKSLSTLLNPPDPASLFPNLHMMASTHDFVPSLHVPIPSLRSISIWTSGHASPNSEYLLEPLPTLFPNIRFLSARDETDGTRVSDCVCRWQGLRSVKCFETFLNWAALTHLSHMRTLSWLEFALRNTLPPSDSTIIFYYLHDLVLHSKSLGSISWFLSRTQLPAVIDFRAIMEYSPHPTMNEFSFFLDTLRASGANNTMERLKFWQAEWGRVSLHREAPILGLNDLRPCTAFRNLIYLSVDMECDVNLTDSGLHALASSWPHLKHLLINEKWSWGTPGEDLGVTPNGLSQLLQTCRSLIEVALVIDTRGYTQFPLNKSFKCLGLTLPPTFSINVIDSIIEVESIQAMSDFFVGLDIMSCSSFTARAWPSRRRELSRDWCAYQTRWDMVFGRATDPANRRFINFEVST